MGAAGKERLVGAQDFIGGEIVHANNIATTNIV